MIQKRTTHPILASIQEQLQDFNNLGADYFNKNNPELQDLEDQTSEIWAEGSDKDKIMIDGQLDIDNDDENTMHQVIDLR